MLIEQSHFGINSQISSPDCNVSTWIQAYNFKPNPEVLNRQLKADGGTAYNPSDFTAFASGEKFTVSGAGQATSLISREDGFAQYSSALNRPLETKVFIKGNAEQTDIGRAIIVTVEHIGGETSKFPVACDREQGVYWYIHNPELNITTKVAETSQIKNEVKNSGVDATKRTLEEERDRLAASATQTALLEINQRERQRGVEEGKILQAATDATKTSLDYREHNRPFVIDVNLAELLKYSLIIGAIMGLGALGCRLFGGDKK